MTSQGFTGQVITHVVKDQVIIQDGVHLMMIMAQWRIHFHQCRIVVQIVWKMDVERTVIQAIVG